MLVDIDSLVVIDGTCLRKENCQLHKDAYQSEDLSKPLQAMVAPYTQILLLLCHSL